MVGLLFTEEEEKQKMGTMFFASEGPCRTSGGMKRC